MYGLYEGRDEFYIVMELFKHGTLLDTITQRERYTEDDARAIVQTLAETLGYCHKQGFMHRDVKVRVRVPPTCMCGTSQIRRSLTLPPRQPANIVSTANGSIKLADFGFATTVDFDAVHQFYNDCGTMAYVVFTTVTRACHSPRQAQPNSPAAAVILNCDPRTLRPAPVHRYMAPEMVKREAYGVEVDVWALGVVLFQLLSGKLPFRAPTTTSVARKIVNGWWSFPPQEWETVSDEARDLIKHLLVRGIVGAAWRAAVFSLLTSTNLSNTHTRTQVVDPLKRYTMQQILDHA